MDNDEARAAHKLEVKRAKARRKRLARQRRERERQREKRDGTLYLANRTDHTGNDQ